MIIDFGNQVRRKGFYIDLVLGALISNFRVLGLTDRLSENGEDFPGRIWDEITYIFFQHRIWYVALSGFYEAEARGGGAGNLFRI